MRRGGVFRRPGQHPHRPLSADRAGAALLVCARAGPRLVSLTHADDGASGVGDGRHPRTRRVRTHPDGRGGRVLQASPPCIVASGRKPRRRREVPARGGVDNSQAFVGARGVSWRVVAAVRPGWDGQPIGEAHRGPGRDLRGGHRRPRVRRARPTAPGARPGKPRILPEACCPRGASRQRGAPLPGNGSSLESRRICRRAHFGRRGAPNLRQHAAPGPGPTDHGRRGPGGTATWPLAGEPWGPGHECHGRAVGTVSGTSLGTGTGAARASSRT